MVPDFWKLVGLSSRHRSHHVTKLRQETVSVLRRTSKEAAGEVGTVHHICWWAWFWGHFTREDLATFCRSQIISNYAIPMSPNLLSHVLAFIPGCLFMRRKETDPLATALFNETVEKSGKTSSIKRIRLSTWSGKNPEKSHTAFSFPDYTSDCPPLFKSPETTRNWFPTPFPGSKTFQRYRSQNPGWTHCSANTICSYIDFHKPKENPISEIPRLEPLWIPSSP